MAEEVSLEEDVPLRVKTLRYFDPHGAFARAAAAAATAPMGAVMLAPVRPTETLALSPPEHEPQLEALARQLAAIPGGQVIDLSGGLKAARLRGARLAEVLARLGGPGLMPQVGAARRGRLADVPVLALGVRAGEVLLVVDRAWAPHLLEWLRATLADLGESDGAGADSRRGLSDG